jgi:pyruvate,orthophosphate dikinase
MSVDLEEGTITLKDKVIKEGDFVSLDFKTGTVYLGQIPVSRVNPDENPDIQQFLQFCDDVRHACHGIDLYSNADSIEAVQRVRSQAAEGIGIYHTDSLVTGDRSESIQRLLLSDDKEEKENVLQELEDSFVGEFTGIFESTAGAPVSVRLIDPLMSEYLQGYHEAIEEFAMLEAKKELGAEVEEEEMNEKSDLAEKMTKLFEANPMVGLRGVRLSLVVPGLLKAQLRGIVEGAAQIVERGGNPPDVEILVPYAFSDGEIRKVKQELESTITAINKEHETPVSVKFGALIEAPRLAVLIPQFADILDVLNFNTDDLTALMFGISREDNEKAMHAYKELKIYAESPFEKLDLPGVGRLVKKGIEEARSIKSDLRIGVSGENLSDEEVVHFLKDAGVNFLSCAVEGLALARIAAAQAAVEGVADEDEVFDVEEEEVIEEIPSETETEEGSEVPKEEGEEGSGEAVARAAGEEGGESETGTYETETGSGTTYGTETGTEES